VASYQILSWQGIPAAVEARDGQAVVTRQLSERFQMLIDSAAMLLGHDAAEAYLEAWARSAPVERPGTADEVAAAVAAELEARFPEFAAVALRPPAGAG